MVRTIMEHLETDPVPLGTSHIPSHIPPRRCVGLCFKRPCASRRDTPHKRACARRAPHPRHAHCPRILRAGRGARSRTSRVSCLGSLSSSCRRSCAWIFYKRAKRWRAPWSELNAPGTRGLFLYSVRDLPWADPPLPGTKNDQKGVRATTAKSGIFLVFTAIVNEQHNPGPQPQHNTNTTPYTRIVFRTARARRGYTQPLVSTTDAAADVYITFPTYRLTQHQLTRMWDGRREVAKLITYAPQYDYDRHVEVPMQLRHNEMNVES